MFTTVPSNRRPIHSTSALLVSIAAFTFGSVATTGHADARVDEPDRAPATISEDQPIDSVLREHQIEAQMNGQHTAGPQIH